MSTKKLQIVGNLLSTDESLTQSGFAADAQVVGDKIDDINERVGSEKVSVQINTAIENIETITDAEIDEICGTDILEVEEVRF